MQRSYFMGIIILLIITACGTGGSVVHPDGELGDACDSNTPCLTGLECIADICAMPEADTTNSTDMFGSCGSEDGCFGSPCHHSEECDSGHCTLHLGDFLCSMACTVECPPGWTCQTDEGADSGYCASNAPNICQPCSTDENCNAPGVNGSCINYGDEGRFCSTECVLDDECPQGYICDVMPNQTASETKYCISETGKCNCPQSSIEEEHQTTCFISNEHGSCEGTRSCSMNGLGDCDASIPSEDICDGIDNDCDGETDNGTEDEASSDAPTWFKDSDGDGYGDPAESIRACTAPEGYEDNSLDCDDEDDTINPNGIEVCDGKDNDCNDTSDEDSATDAGTWYEDKDGDGHGNAGVSVVSCNAPNGYVSLSDDCYDGDSSIYPDAAEYCDGMDNNCNDEVDEGDAAPQTYYADFDSDNYGNSEVTSTGCGAPPNYVLQMGDCNDFDAQINPEGVEVCDGVDNDCNNAVDEGDAAPSTYYADFDNDGHGSNTVTQSACTTPPNYIAVSGDCNDFDAQVNPDATEVCDGLDNNCDNATDDGDASPTLWYPDFDGDGHGSTVLSTTACAAPSNYTASSGDCDDFAPFVSPTAAEICDGIDNDCDGFEDESTCDDSIGCTIDACDAVTGCSQTPDDTPCQTLLDPADSLCKLAICDATEGCKVITETSCCGNGLIEGGEECDDGNADPGDGCATSCTLECISGTMEYPVAGLYNFTMPEGCNTLEVMAWGAAGGGTSGGGGGGGGYVQSFLHPNAGDELHVLVGSGGGGFTSLQFGDGGIGYSHGGGRSSIAVENVEVLIAGGGGGGQEGSNGGAGGGLQGENASGFGGTQSAGGSPGSGSDGVGVGSYLTGGRGSSASCPACGSSSNLWSSGGGGGYYGGGGGGGAPAGGGWTGRGGGGGSSLVPPGGTTSSGIGLTPGNPFGADGAGTGVVGSPGYDGKIILHW